MKILSGQIAAAMVVLFVFIAQSNSKASQIESITATTGLWSDSNSWQSGTIPGNANCFDTVLIKTGIDIGTQVSMASCGPVIVLVQDTLRFISGFKLHLPSGSLVVVDTFGYVYPQGTGNSNQIFIGGVEYWRSSDGPISGITFVDVTYTLFEVIHRNNFNFIRWETASETNNDHFVVEESTDGSSFTEVGKVKGAGNSAKLLRYQYKVYRPGQQTFYYRLAQVDYDGTTSYTPIVSLKTGTALSGVSMWVDNNILQIDIPEELEEVGLRFQLVNEAGQVVRNETVDPKAVSSVDLSNHSAGLYHCIISSDRERLVTKTFLVH